MATDEFDRDASVVAFTGRLTSLQNGRGVRSDVNANLFAPNLSAALLGKGGRSLSRTSKPIDFNVAGVGVASLASSACEVYDRNDGDKIWVYASGQVRDLRVGVDRRFHLERGEAELASTFFPERPNERAFYLRGAVASGVEFGGQPISVTFLSNLPSNFQELKNYVCRNKLLLENYPDYIEFHAVKELEGPNKKSAHQLELEGFGTVQFGVMRAGPAFRTFTLVSFGFGQAAEVPEDGGPGLVGEQLVAPKRIARTLSLDEQSAMTTGGSGEAVYISSNGRPG
jgi:hypothetical protein